MEADEGSLSMECDNTVLDCQLPFIRHPLSEHIGKLPNTAVRRKEDCF